MKKYILLLSLSCCLIKADTPNCTNGSVLWTDPDSSSNAQFCVMNASGNSAYAPFSGTQPNYFLMCNTTPKINNPYYSQIGIYNLIQTGTQLPGLAIENENCVALNLTNNNNTYLLALPSYDATSCQNLSNQINAIFSTTAPVLSGPVSNNSSAQPASGTAVQGTNSTSIQSISGNIAANSKANSICLIEFTVNQNALPKSIGLAMHINNDGSYSTTSIGAGWNIPRQGDAYLTNIAGFTFALNYFPFAYYAKSWSPSGSGIKPIGNQGNYLNNLETILTQNNVITSSSNGYSPNLYLISPINYAPILQ